MEITVSKVKTVKANRRDKYPFKSMKVGESFPIDEMSLHSALVSSRSWVRRSGNDWVFESVKDTKGNFRIKRAK